MRGFFENRGDEDTTDLTKYQIAKLPDGPPLKSFGYPGKQLLKSLTLQSSRNAEDSLNEGGPTILEQTKLIWWL